MKKQEHKCLFCGTAMRREFRPFGIQHNEQMVGDRPGQRILFAPSAARRRTSLSGLCILKCGSPPSHQERNPLSGDELRFLRGLLLLNGRNSRAVLAFHPRPVAYEKVCTS